MFCSKNQYSKIQEIHHKVLRVVFNSDDGYDELLQMSNEITIHGKQLHALICEVFKTLNNSNPEFMWSYFTFKNIKHNFRNGPLLKLPISKSMYYGIISVHFKATVLWNDLSQSLKHSEYILNWKENLKNWEMLTALAFYVDHIINKNFIVFSWFLLAFATCKHQW